MFNKSANTRFTGTAGPFLRRVSVALCLALFAAGAASAAGIKVVPSAPKVTPGESFYADIVVEDVPAEGLGAVQFRLNVSAPGSPVTAVSDTGQGQSADVSVSSPLFIGESTAGRSGIGGFFWNAKSPHGILVMENEPLRNGNGLYTLGHTNGAALPSGSGPIARFQIGTGTDVVAEKIVISLSDVALLEGRNVYPLENNVGATVDLKCYTHAPNLIGMTGAEAEASLVAAKLSPGSVYEIDNTDGAHALDTVLQQSVNAGATVLCDTPVDLAINTAPAEAGNVQAADKPGDESGAIVFSWVPSASPDAAGYRIYTASGVRLADTGNASSTGAEVSGQPMGTPLQFRITAYDSHGNESAGAAVSVTAADDVAPRITVAGVVENAYYRTDVQPVITVQEASPAVQEITLNGAAYAQLPVTSEGTYLLRISATDTSGNSSVKEIGFTIDKTAPVIIVTGLTHDAYYNHDLAPAISFTDANLETAESSLNGSAYTGGTAITAENAYELVLQAADKAGNSSSATYRFFIDRTVPASTIAVGTPRFESGGTLSVSGTTTFTVTGSDSGAVESGVDRIEYRTNGAAWNPYQAPVSLAGLGDGTVTMDYRAVDRAGNVEDFHTLTVVLDSSAPVTTLAAGQPQYTDAAGAVYVTQETVFTLSAADALSGAASTEYKVDAGEWIPAAPFTIALEGAHTILYRSQDNLGNAEPEKSFFVHVDTTPPATTITTGDPHYAAADGKLYVTSAGAFTLAATDNLSGVASTEYRIDGGAWTAYAPFNVAAEGAHTVEYRSADNVGNAETAGALAVTVDNTPPATTLTMSGGSRFTDAGGKLHIASAVTFTLAATDDLSGVASTEYRIDGGAWTPYAPFTVAAEGAHTVEYRSTDNVGNAEAVQSLAVIVDNAPPATTITTGDPHYSAADGKRYVTSTSAFTLAATDDLSGVASTEYRIDGGAWTAYAPFTIAAEGAHTIEYRSTDNVGNAEVVQILAVTVDNAPPATTITTGDPHYVAADGKRYVTSASAFTLAATDNLSGVASTEYRIDGGAWTPYAPFTIAAEGAHTVEYRSTDNVGNAEAVQILAVILDNAPPATTITAGDPHYAAADGKRYVTAASAFTLAATDNLSGVASTEYRIDGGTWTAYAPFTIAAEGAHTVEYRSADNVANTEAVRTLAVIVDNTAPATDITVGLPQYGSDGTLYVSAATNITITAADAASGVTRTEFSVDGGEWNGYTAAFTLHSSADGGHTIRYRSVDNVGNPEEAKELAVILDTTPPQTSLTASDDLSGGVINTVSPSTFFTLTAADALSGVRSIAYRIDDDAWQAYTGSFSLAGRNAGQHTIAYKATDNVLNEEAEGTVTVRLILLEVEKSAAANSSVLVGVESDKSDLARKQADMQRLAAILSSINVNYAITDTPEDFTAALRSGRYGTYILLDVKDPLAGEEVREAVRSGSGLVFIKTKPDADPFLDDVFGVKFTGRTTSDDLTVDLLSSPISAEGTLRTAGKSVVSTISSDGAQVFGSAADKHATHPSIVYNGYGRGRVLLYTFDLPAAEEQSLASALLIGSLNFVRPAAQAPAALDSVPIRITLGNSAVPAEVTVEETFPAGTTADTIVPAATPGDNTLTWRKSLASGETATFRYTLNLPDAAGDYPTETTVSYDNNGSTLIYGTYQLVLNVRNGSADLRGKVLDELRGLEASTTRDADLLAKAIEDLQAVNDGASTRKEAENNIRSIVKTIDEVRNLSVDASSIRTGLDELLRIWEKKWYLMEPEG